jgi:hypothetical protein
MTTSTHPRVQLPLQAHMFLPRHVLACCFVVSCVHLMLIAGVRRAHPIWQAGGECQMARRWKGVRCRAAGSRQHLDGPWRKGSGRRDRTPSSEQIISRFSTCIVQRQALLFNIDIPCLRIERTLTNIGERSRTFVWGFGRACLVSLQSRQSEEIELLFPYKPPL